MNNLIDALLGLCAYLHGEEKIVKAWEEDEREAARNRGQFGISHQASIWEGEAAGIRESRIALVELLAEQLKKEAGLLEEKAHKFLRQEENRK